MKKRLFRYLSRFKKQKNQPALLASDEKSILGLAKKRDQYINKALELDQKIVAVQRSTRTLVPQMAPLHNYFRMKWKWYYKWHMWKYASLAHWMLLILVILGSLYLGFYSAALKKPRLLAQASVTAEKQHFSRKEAPAFYVDAKGLVGESADKEQKEKFQGSKGSIAVALMRPNNPNTKIAFKPTIVSMQTDKGDFSIELKEYSTLEPGEYTLSVTINDGQEEKILNLDFAYGVLSINTNKSIYLPNEQAYLQMGSLNSTGHTLCNSNLKLSIISPNGSAPESEISKNSSCGPDNVTDLPDYSAYYTTKETGTYQMELTNQDNGYKVSDSFEVKESVLFDVERVGSSRIYPFADYTMTVKVKANQDITGGTITESVPAGFEIKASKKVSKSANSTSSSQASQQEGIEQFNNATIEQLNNDVETITWHDIDLKSGDSLELQYTYDAPDKSPEFYLLGPLVIKSEYLNPKSETNSNSQNPNDQNGQTNQSSAPDSSTTLSPSVIPAEAGIQSGDSSAPNASPPNNTPLTQPQSMLNIDRAFAADNNSAIEQSNNSVWQEVRQWQIASDGIITVFPTGTTWNVPDDWSTTNNIETIGAGGGGRSGGTKAGGGGGGAYSYLQNSSSFTAGSTIKIGISATGGTAGLDGGDTFVCSDQACTDITSATAIVGAKGGKGGPSGGSAGAGGAGGLASESKGTAVNGGTGGTGTQNGGNGGGGGAGGPGGPTAGETGGNGDTTTAGDDAGGGGGGAGGTSSDVGANGTATFGAGGPGPDGTGGGATAGASGTSDKGGGGAGGAHGGSGGQGGSGSEWTTKGAGGGGAGAGNGGLVGGAGGAYGGGGGGGTTGGTGGAGLIAVTYTAAAGCYAKVTGNWNTGSNWTGCSGSGGIPGAGDDVIISKDITITMDVASPTINSLKINGTLNTITGGTSYAISTATLNITSTGTLTANNSTITISGTGTTVFQNSGTFTYGTSRVSYTNATSATILSMTGAAGSNGYYDLDTNGAGTFTLGGNTVVNRVLSISAGTLDASSYDLTLAGTTGTPFTKAGSFTASTSTVKYTGDYGSGNTNVVSTTYNNLYLDNTSETFDAAGDITVNTTFTINAGTFDGKTYTLTLAGTGTPFVKTGTFTYSTSKVSYTNATSATILALTGISGTNGYYDLDTNGAGTFTLGGATVVNHDLSISAGTLDASSSGHYALTVNHNWTNSGTFNAQDNTVTLGGAGASTQTLSGNTTFYDLTSTATAARTIKFTAGSVTTVSHTWTVTGATSQLITLTSTTTSVWTINPTAASVSYVDVNYSTNTGASFCATYSQSTNNGNTGWDISASAACPINVGGNIYQTGSESSLDTTGYTIAISVNNGSPTTTAVSPGSSSYSFSDAASQGDKVIVYIQGVSANANSFTIAGSANITDLHLYIGKTNVMNHNGGATTNVNICSQSSYPTSGDATFTCDGSNNIDYTTNSAIEAHIASNYTPAANITTSNLHILAGANYTAGSTTITVTGTGTPFVNAGTFTYGTSTFTYTGDGDVTVASMTGSSGINGYYRLTLSPAITDNRTYTLAGAERINGTGVSGDCFQITPTALVAKTLTVNMGGDITLSSDSGSSSCRIHLYGGDDPSLATAKLDTISGQNYAITNGGIDISYDGILDANNSILTLNSRIYAPFRVNGTFNAGGSTVIINSTTSEGSYVRVIDSDSSTITFNNLQFTPTIATNFSYFLMNYSGDITVNGDFDIKPTASAAKTLTISLYGNITVASNKTTTIQGLGAGPASAVLKTRNSDANDFNFSTGTLAIAANGTLDCTSSLSTIAISGTGSAFTNSGTFNYGTSKVSYTNATSATILALTGTSGTNGYYNLDTNGAGTYTLGGATKTNNNLTITSGTLAAGNYALTISGNYSNSGTFTAGTGTVTFDATDGGHTLAGRLNNVTTTSAFYKVVFSSASGTSGAWTIQDPMLVTFQSGDNTSALDIGNGTVTLGNGANDNLEVDGKFTIANTANQTGTFQTYAVAQADGTITIDMNNNSSPNACTYCILVVGATSGTGQGTLDINKNTIVRLNPNTVSSDTGIEVESTGKLDVQGTEDQTGADDTAAVGTNETLICLNDDAESYTADQHNGKVVRMTSGLAFGKIYTIDDTTNIDVSCANKSSITRTTTASTTDTNPTVSGSGSTRTISMSNQTIITADNDFIGRYVYDEVSGAYFKIVDSDDNTTDTLTVIAEPGSFSNLASTDDIHISDGIRSTDTYEIYDYAHITAENGTACNAATNEANDAYIYASSGSETIIKYAEICNLGNSGFLGLSFSLIDGASSNAGVSIDHTNIHHNYYGIYLYGSDNNVFDSNRTSNNSWGHYFEQSSNNLTTNSVSSDNVYDGFDLTQSSNNNIVSDNYSYNNADSGFWLDFGSSNNVYVNNQSYNNTHGLSFGWDGTGSAATGNNFVNNYFGSSGYNVTDDIHFYDTKAHTANFYNTTFASTEKSGTMGSSAYIISKKHDTTAGATKIWGAYATPADNAETPQDEDTDKFNYANNSWEKSVTAHGYSGTGTEDTNLSYDLSAPADLSGGPYAYRVATKTAGSGTNCGTSQAVFDVFRNGTDVGDATSGTQFTDSNGSVNLKFTIDCGTTAYAVGDTYTFVAYDASNDGTGGTPVAKAITMMQNGDSITVGANKSLELKGQSAGTNLSTISRDSSLSGAEGYHIDINGTAGNNATIDAQYYTISYLGGTSGGNGLNLGAYTTVTNLADGTYNNYQNVGATDTYIKVDGALIGTGTPSKTFANVTFTEASDNVPEYTVTESGGSPVAGNYWLFDTTATCTGWASCESSDSDAGDGGSDPNGYIHFTAAGGNQTPTNDSLTFTNPYSSNIAVADDTTEWNFRVLVTDTDGSTDINYVELRLANSTDSAQPYDSLKFRWTEATDTFSEEADTQASATLTSTNANSSAAGNQWTLDFKVKIDGSFSTEDTNYAAEVYSVDDPAAADTDNYVDKYQVDQLSVSVAVDSPTLAFGGLLPGSIITGTTVTTVTTNYGNGYTLAVHDSVAGSDSVLLHTDASTRIADYSGTIATPTSWSGTGLGICVYSATGKDTSKWGTGDTEGHSSNKYAGIPETATTIHTKTGSPTSGDNSSIGYKLVVPNTQKTGDYSGIVTFTATGVLQ